MLYIRGKKRFLWNTYIQRNDFKIDQGLDLYFILSVNIYLTFYLKTSIFLIYLFYFSLCYIKLLHSGSICGRLLSLVSCIIYYTTCSQPVLALASVQHRIKKAKKIPKAKAKKNPKTTHPTRLCTYLSTYNNPTLTLLLYPYAFHLRLLL